MQPPCMDMFNLIEKQKMKIKKNGFGLLAAAWLCSSTLTAQFTLSGKVESSSGEAIPYAIVGIKNTQLSAITNDDGSFIFKGLKSNTYIITAKSVGFTDRIDTVIINGDTQYSLVLKVSNKQLDEVIVNATRVDKTSGMAFNNVDEVLLNKQNLGQDAPYMLGQLPSVVVNSDAGNGIGYTGLRIRGSDGTRINVTINGVPVNDAESQGTFFVNMPDFVSSTNNIQVQRGVGASSNGAGAFGASINFQTNQLNDKPYAKAISTAGSFRTFRNTLMAGTGMLNNKFTLDARASSITSDGYIDRAKSDLQSYYLAAGYYGEKTVLKFINFLGQEKTYQAWNYVPEDSIKAGNRTYNEIGAYTDVNGNLKYYSNETDNYKQNNFQLHAIHKFNSNWNVSVTGHYTKGKGYYEQYKPNENLSDYQINPPIFVINDSTNIVVSESDLIRRKWLDNDFAGGIFNINYTANARLSFVLGGGFNSYFGKHFGNVIWAKYASNSEIQHQYYFNTANKNDANAYLKINFKPIQGFNVFVDAQVRNVEHSFFGLNEVFLETKQIKSYTFFNPKVGMSYDISASVNVYASWAMANKEPNRTDFVENSVNNRPKPEQLQDVEFGAKYAAKKIYAALNFYNMQYKNQLVLNGQLNDVGSPKRVNVASSYRRGLEAELNVSINKYFDLGGNITLSKNKIAKFNEFIDSSYYVGNDYIFYEQKNEYVNTDILLSPNVVSSVIFSLKPIKNLEISFINKYVGRQFLDNTTNTKRSINPYNVVDTRINYTVNTKLIPEISFMLSVYNVLNQNFETNGYTFGYYYDGTLNTFNYKAPSAPINFLGGVSLKF